jgi:hypothetical protein
MGTDLSTTEKLQVIADKSSRKIQITEIPYPNSVMDPVTYHRRTVYMPNDSQENAFFVCF